jgi:hypothetical protein
VILENAQFSESQNASKSLTNIVNVFFTNLGAKIVKRDVSFIGIAIAIYRWVSANGAF